ncbi:MAG TPA: STAS-like domain-containing protein [Bacteroidales bacterium]|nr:STAS-like domain-containing protein [Bacteroidales bacterium]HPS16169.1 STAS-like domain-containing protein [Bacteroidales bacterium]
MEIEKYTINIFNEIGGDSAISVDDGDMIYKKIDNALSQGLIVILDFQNINLIITAFLNAAIGQLYSKYTSEQLNSNLKLENIKPEDVLLFIKVIKNAKNYFDNPEDFENTVKEP